MDYYHVRVRPAVPGQSAVKKGGAGPSARRRKLGLIEFDAGPELRLTETVAVPIRTRDLRFRPPNAKGASDNVHAMINEWKRLR